jgi:hypothetical protein
LKILVSGVTREQANARVNTPKFSMIQGVPAIVRSLKNLGHEVDHRQVFLGEDLNGRYDSAVIALSPTNSFPANKCGLGALWAIGALDCPVIIYWEDWQYRATLSGLRRLMRAPQDLDKKTSKGDWFYQDDRDLVAKHGSRLIEVAAGLLQPWRRLYGVVPAYEWGDLSIPQGDLPSGARTGRIDLAPEAMRHIMPAYDRIVEQLKEPKEQQWTCASLVDHDNWIEKQKLSWPVQLFGRRRGSTSGWTPRVTWRWRSLARRVPSAPSTTTPVPAGGGRGSSPRDSGGPSSAPTPRRPDSRPWGLPTPTRPPRSNSSLPSSGSTWPSRSRKLSGPGCGTRTGSTTR